MTTSIFRRCAISFRLWLWATLIFLSVALIVNQFNQYSFNDGVKQIFVSRHDDLAKAIAQTILSMRTAQAGS